MDDDCSVLWQPKQAGMRIAGRRIDRYRADFDRSEPQGREHLDRRSIFVKARSETEWSRETQVPHYHFETRILQCVMPAKCGSQPPSSGAKAGCHVMRAFRIDSEDKRLHN